MKRIFLILSIIIGSFNLYSQNLTMSEILKIREMDVGEVDQLLTTKGWTLYDVEKGNDGKKSLLGYAYKFNQRTLNAESLLTCIFNPEMGLAILLVDINNRGKYLEYLKYIQDNGYKRILSNISDDGNLITVYRDSETTFRISKSTGVGEDFRGEGESWFFTILSNKEYEILYDD